MTRPRSTRSTSGSPSRSSSPPLVLASLPVAKAAKKIAPFVPPARPDHPGQRRADCGGRQRQESDRAGGAGRWRGGDRERRGNSTSTAIAAVPLISAVGSTRQWLAPKALATAPGASSGNRSMVFIATIHVNSVEPAPSGTCDCRGKSIRLRRRPLVDELEKSPPCPPASHCRRCAGRPAAASTHQRSKPADITSVSMCHVQKPWPTVRCNHVIRDVFAWRFGVFGSHLLFQSVR